MLYKMRKKTEKTEDNAINQFYSERMVEAGSVCWVITLQTHAANMWNGLRQLE